MNNKFANINNPHYFNRTFTIFGIIIILLFSFKLINQNKILFLILIILLPIFLKIENELKIVMNKIVTSSSYFNITPIYLIPWSIFLFFILIILFLFIIFYSNLNNNLFSIYLFTLFINLTIYLFSSILKSLLIGTGLINFKYIRRGFFGVFQRFFILISNIILSFFWIKYFCNIINISFFQIFQIEKTFSCLIYIVTKCLVLIILLWDFGFSIGDYSANGISSFRSSLPEEVIEECVVCQDKPFEPVTLTCGHVFCYQCAFKWLSENSTCPFCRTKITEPHPIEFADGFLPVFVLFSCF